MNKTQVQGFALNEVLITTAVIGVMGVMALGAYQWYIPKAQVDEAAKLILLEAANSTPALSNSTCPTKAVKGKYGQLTFSGSYINSKGKSCPSGCTVQYSFNSDAHSQLKGKVLVADILNNHKAALNSSTTIANSLIPHVFATGTPNVGDNCAAQVVTTPTKTDGSDEGDETGVVDPNAPVTPPSGGSNGGGDPDPTNPSGSGSNTPDVSVNEIPGLPVGSSHWTFVTSDSNYSTSNNGFVTYATYPKRTKSFTVDFLMRGEYGIAGMSMNYDLTIVANLGTSYANKSVQVLHEWGFIDTHYPNLLSASGSSGVVNLVADSKGFIKTPVFSTSNQLVTGFTKDKFTVTYNNQRIYVGYTEMTAVYDRY